MTFFDLDPVALTLVALALVALAGWFLRAGPATAAALTLTPVRTPEKAKGSTMTQMRTGDVFGYTASATDAGGHAGATLDAPTYTVSDPSVLGLDTQASTIRALKPGTAQLVLTAGAVKATADVEVVPGPAVAAEIHLAPSVPANP